MVKSKATSASAHLKVLYKERAAKPERVVAVPFVVLGEDDTRGLLVEPMLDPGGDALVLPPEVCVEWGATAGWAEALEAVERADPDRVAISDEGFVFDGVNWVEPRSLR